MANEFSSFPGLCFSGNLRHVDLGQSWSLSRFVYEAGQLGRSFLFLKSMICFVFVDEVRHLQFNDIVMISSRCNIWNLGSSTSLI